jgi:hypothetical protein
VARRWDIVLQSDYAPEVCAGKLAKQIDPDKPTLFSLSGYGGSEPVVGRIEGNKFRLHCRRYWRNNFGPVLFGRMSAQGKGSPIEGYWDMAKWTRTFMRVWIILAVVIGTPIFFTSLKCAVTATCGDRSNDWVGLLVPPGMVLFGLLLPRLGAVLSFHERKRITNLLQQGLVAGPTPSPSLQRAWSSSLDDYSLWV